MARVCRVGTIDQNIRSVLHPKDMTHAANELAHRLVPQPVSQLAVSAAVANGLASLAKLQLGDTRIAPPLATRRAAPLVCNGA